MLTIKLIIFVKSSLDALKKGILKLTLLTGLPRTLLNLFRSELVSVKILHFKCFSLSALAEY